MWLCSIVCIVDRSTGECVVIGFIQSIEIINMLDAAQVSYMEQCTRLD